MGAHWEPVRKTAYKCVTYVIETFQLDNAREKRQQFVVNQILSEWKLEFCQLESIVIATASVSAILRDVKHLVPATSCPQSQEDALEAAP